MMYLIQAKHCDEAPEGPIAFRCVECSFIPDLQGRSRGITPWRCSTLRCFSGKEICLSLTSDFSRTGHGMIFFQVQPPILGGSLFQERDSWGSHASRWQDEEYAGLSRRIWVRWPQHSASLHLASQATPTCLFVTLDVYFIVRQFA